ncbi:GNAT family N-acetyltransferase [Paenibacillus sp. BR2-3]|uniref:GNAT family N-acetyltransferase n=1 Tax=Paenibacillus sp. BR2-3 TaxID=3048494 RepID=UPI003977A841
MSMLIDLKHLIGTPEVKELLTYAVIDEPDALQQTLAEYSEQPALQLYGWEEDGLLLGLVGYEETEDGSLEVKHIAVLPENRGKGYARGMILELLTARQPRYLMAETEDEVAANFYRSLGFMVYSLGENGAGIELFRCVYETDESEDEE